MNPARGCGLPKRTAGGPPLIAVQVPGAPGLPGTAVTLPGNGLRPAPGLPGTATQLPAPGLPGTATQLPGPPGFPGITCRRLISGDGGGTFRSTMILRPAGPALPAARYVTLWLAGPALPAARYVTLWPAGPRYVRGLPAGTCTHMRPARGLPAGACTNTRDRGVCTWALNAGIAVQATIPGVAAARARPQSPAQISATGSRPPAALGRRIAKTAATATAATVHTVTPSTTMPTAATGTSRAPLPRRRSSRDVIRHSSVISIHILPWWPWSGPLRYGLAPSPW